ncbi:uncharacterized protein LOC109461232 [Rhinolophus sinicus]|uniref:uncharacterized protein LOC109461232 n=1 Tax=Rhinolophus sinicus TaxID=89399 RepID=UPI003D78F27A
MEAVKDLNLQSRSQKTLVVGERKPDNSRGSHCFPEKVDEEEVGEQNSYPQGAVPSAAWLAQFEKVDEAIQCDRSWWQDAELERFLEQMPLLSEELSPECTTQESREKLRNRKLKTGDQVQSLFLNRKTVNLKKNALLHIAPPDNSDDCNLEEEYEVEWLFEDDSSVSSKEKVYREACRATRLSHGPCYPELVWSRINKNDSSKYAEYENIPLLCMAQRSEGREVLYSKLRTEHSAKQEGESRESLESEKSQG